MKVSVFGLGYVGCVTAVSLAKDGHDVIGVDISPEKISLIKAGRSPIVEPGVPELIGEVVKSGKLQVTLDGKWAVQNSDLSLICVGTPSNSNGSLKLDFIEKVSQEIGEAIATKPDYHVVVMRSTVLPCTLRDKIIPILSKASGLRAGVDFGVSMNPEFLREGSAVKDYFDPSFIIIGQFDERSRKAVDGLYTGINAQVVHTDLETAEMVKYACNAYHALKVTFANEIGDLCKSHGLDGQKVMKIFCMDERLNISPAYLMPGFAFGGSCLPKDLRALLYRAREKDLDCKVLSAVLPSNQEQIQRGISLVESTGRKKIGILGLSFKGGTDDVRESPVVPLVETLVGRGYDVSIFDEKVELSRMIGQNKSFIEQTIPHISTLMRSSVDEVIKQSEVVVLTGNNEAYSQISQSLDDNQILIDLTGIAKPDPRARERYEGIGW